MCCDCFVVIAVMNDIVKFNVMLLTKSWQLKQGMVIGNPSRRQKRMFICKVRIRNYMKLYSIPDLENAINVSSVSLHRQSG